MKTTPPKEQSHSALPWHWWNENTSRPKKYDLAKLLDNGGMPVFTLYGGSGIEALGTGKQAKANAKLIVEAVNSHARLLAHNEMLRKALDGMLGNYIEMKRIILITASSDAPNWIGARITPEDDIHVIAARAALEQTEEK